MSDAGRDGPTRDALTSTTYKRVREWVKRVFHEVHRLATQRFTLMIIPHSERKTITVEAGILAAGFLVAVLLSAAAGAVYAGVRSPEHTQQATRIEEELEGSQASLDALRGELREVMRAHRNAREALEGVVGAMDAEVTFDDPSTPSQADLSAFFESLTPPDETRQTIGDVRKLSTTLEEAEAPLAKVRQQFVVLNEVLDDIPNHWPVAGGRGRVTSEFGPNFHPFSGQLYLHKGFDVADAVGTSVVAAADGRVTEVGVHPLYGNQVWLRHKHGFRTMYAHLNAVTVGEGDEVKKGGQVGLLGNSGLSSGPHVHLEVWLGEEVLDPAMFLQMSNEFSRSERGS